MTYCGDDCISFELHFTYSEFNDIMRNFSLTLAQKEYVLKHKYEYIINFDKIIQKNDILTLFPNIDEIIIYNGYKTNLLHLACIKRKYYLAKSILLAGADPNLEIEEITPLLSWILGDYGDSQCPARIDIGINLFSLFGVNRLHKKYKSVRWFPNLDVLLKNPLFSDLFE